MQDARSRWWARRARLGRYARLGRFAMEALRGRVLAGVGLVLTRRCNLDCPYCRIVDRDGHTRRRELQPAQWMRIIDRFAQHGHRHFIFTGGEPLLYQGLDALVDHASRRALTSLITNATLLDADRLSRLRRLDFLTFSWDTIGADVSAGTPALVKDPGPRLAEIARACREHAIFPSAILTVTATNADQIVPLVLRLDVHGIPSLLSLIHEETPPEAGEGAVPEAGEGAVSEAGESPVPEDPERWGTGAFSHGPVWDFRGKPSALAFRTPEQRERLRRLAGELIALGRRGVRVGESERYLRGMIDYVEGRYRMDCPAADPFFTVDVDGRIKACHDLPASQVHALEFQDYREMQRQVRATVPAGCGCYYDCYVEARSTPWQTVRRGLRRLTR